MSGLRNPRIIAALFFMCLLAACGGGGGSSVTPVASGGPSSGAGSVTLVVGGPNATVNSATARPRPHFVGAAVTSIAGRISIGPTLIANASVSCPQTPAPAPPCTLTLYNIAAGSYTFDITALDSSRNALSHVSVPITVTAATATTVRATLNGLLYSASLALAQPLAMNGTSTTTQLLVNAYDIDGELILAPGNYENGPINLTVTPADPALANTLKLSALSVNGPSDRITVSYDGKSYESLNVAVTPQMMTPSGQYAAMLIAPQLPTTMYSVPSGMDAIGAPVFATDGSVWAPAHLSLVHITTSGQISEYCVNPGAPQIAPGANGKIFFGLSETYEPAPGASSCATTNQGLRSIDATGAVAQIPFPQWTQWGNITGPVTAPDGTLWVAVDQAGASYATTLVHFDTSGNTLGSVQLSYNYSGPGLGTIAPDGSFWYPWGANVLRCTSAGTCSVGTTVLGQPYIFGITPGANNDMIVTGTNVIYDVDLNEHVLNTISVPPGGNICTAYAVAGGGYWCGWWSMGSGHLMLMRYNTSTHGFSYVQLGAVDNQDTQAPFGLTAAPDGRLWFVHGSNVGVVGPVL